MEEEVTRLVAKLQQKAPTIPPSERYLVAISGIPGSGKTTLAATVAARLNAAATTTAALVTATGANDQGTLPLCAFVPMDGYHLSRAQLSAMPNAAEAHERRGAAFTFDADSFLRLVKAIRKQKPGDDVVYAPSFDHALKDPKADDIAIRAGIKIVIFEGLYLSLGTGTWKDVAELMDELWFVDVGFETAVRRLTERHVRTGVAPSWEEGEKRARGSDYLNALEIVRDRIEKVDEVIVSREDEAWAPEAQRE